MFALGVLWVGGWSFLFFDPHRVLKIFRMQDPDNRKSRRIRIAGGIGLGWTAMSCVVTFVVGLFR